MKLHSIIRCLIIAATMTWWQPASAVHAHIDDRPVAMPSNFLPDIPHGLSDTEFSGGRGRQWAALSPEQRERLRDQVREHRQQQREERREMRNNDPGRGRPEWRQEQRPQDGQRLSPEDREEFRQWMRERRDRRDANRQ